MFDMIYRNAGTDKNTPPQFSDGENIIDWLRANRFVISYAVHDSALQTSHRRKHSKGLQISLYSLAKKRNNNSIYNPNTVIAENQQAPTCNSKILSR